MIWLGTDLTCSVSERPVLAVPASHLHLGNGIAYKRRGVVMIMAEQCFHSSLSLVPSNCSAPGTQPHPVLSRSGSNMPRQSLSHFHW